MLTPLGASKLQDKGPAKTSEPMPPVPAYDLAWVIQSTEVYCHPQAGSQLATSHWLRLCGSH